jgi:nitrogen-specific signal transduction histidine kinase
MFKKLRMLGRGDKFPFVFRTVAVMIAIYLFVGLAATWVVAGDYSDQVRKSTEKQVNDIAGQLRVCEYTNTDSAAFSDGINTALAATILRYYKYQIFRTYQHYDGQVDLTLYRTKSVKDKVTSIRDFTVATPVMTGAPLYTNSKIIVFADCFNKEQLARLTKVYEKAEDVSYIPSARGYQKGRFFYPNSITLEFAGMKAVKFTTNYKGSGGKQITTDLQDYQIWMPDGRVIGKYDEENYISSSFHKAVNSKVKSEIMSGGSTYGTADIKGLDYTCGFRVPLLSDKYCLSLTVKVNTWEYAFRHLVDYYVCALLIMMILASMLIMGHNDVISRKFENERRRRLMADSMAHEMKNPLGIIRNSGEFLLEEQHDDKCRKYARAVIDESIYMNDVVVSMLDLSKMEAGTYPLELSEFDPDEVLRDVVERNRPLLESKDLKLEYDGQPGNNVYADKRLIFISAANFLSNAIRHAEAGSTVILSLTLDKGRFGISVYNKGAQIAEDKLGKIWEAYYYDGSRQGSGLGLAIVRNIAILHGGRYGCSNEAEGMKFWAEFLSQESRETVAAVMSGPVINVTGSQDTLKGMIAVSIGMMIQGLFSTIQVSSAFSGLIYNPSNVMYLMATLTSLDLIMLAGFIIGAGLMLLGMRSLKKKGQNVRIVSILLSLMIAISLIDITVYKASENVGSGSGYYEMLLSGTYMMLAIAMPVVMVMIFRLCARAAESRGNNREGLKLKRTGMFLAAIMAVLYFLNMCSWTIGMTIVAMLPWLVISVIAAVSWLRAYRKYD